MTSIVRAIRALAVGALSLGSAVPLAAQPVVLNRPNTQPASPAQPGTAAPTPATPGETQNGWPRQYATGTLTFTVYQPQVESWDQTNLKARAAVAVLRQGADAPEYGTIEFDARTLIDKEGEVVTLSDIHIIGSGEFPAAGAAGASYVEALRQQLVAAPTQIDLGRLEASLAIAQATKQGDVQPVDNTPPRIIYSPVPAVLVRIDGTPVLRNLGNSGFMRVINTRALIVLDQKSGKYFLRLLGGWMQADAVEGPWAVQASPPPALDQALAAARADEGIDLMDPTAESKFGITQVVAYVTTDPAELIQTDAEPDFAPIEGTQILYAQDTESQLFLYLPEQRFYFLVSGRWFRSPSLQNGPWEYVDYAQLPADFAKIPEGHPSGGALASIAGTPQASEAVIANSIPQTAEVQLASPPALNVAYDGQPSFEAIEGTQLQGALNTLTPVVCVSPTSYYACENGVWFRAGAAIGPWAVATEVPAVIYSIPVRSRFHYLTYCRVYRTTPEVVVVGYTPGYFGTVVVPSGCVVYGTGYRYRPYCGAFWVPPPLTYGWGATFSVGYRTGFSFGFTGGWDIGVWAQPCWGGFGWNRVHRDFRVVSFNHYNTFRHWDRGVVVRQRVPFREPGRDIRREPGRDFGREVVHAPARIPNNVVAGHDGGVFRRTETGGLERHDSGQWKPLGNEQADRDHAAEVNREMAARGHGEERARAAREQPRVVPGGEMHRPSSVPVSPHNFGAPPARNAPPAGRPAEGRPGGGGRDGGGRDRPH